MQTPWPRRENLLSVDLTQPRPLKQPPNLRGPFLGIICDGITDGAGYQLAKLELGSDPMQRQAALSYHKM